MKIINIASYDSFVEIYQQYEEKRKTVPLDELDNLILLFVASEEAQTKQSWCPDCRNTKPLFDKVIEKFQFNDKLSLAIIQVGQREDWKDPKNPFRQHDVKVTAVPTLLSLKSNLRLVENECADEEKVYHLFSNSM